MPANLADEHERLLEFLYRCPIGIAEIGNSGDIRLLNAKGTQFLMQITDSGVLNLFTILAPLNTSLQKSVAAFHAASGTICEEVRIALAPTPSDKGATHLSFTLVKLEHDVIMAAFSDVSAVVAAEVATRQAAERDALQRGRIETVATVLHDIGNGITGIGTRVARLVAETQWPEQNSLTRLRSMFESQEAALTLGFGNRGRLIIEMVRTIESALMARHSDWDATMLTFGRAVTHIRQIISLQRTLVGNGSLGQLAPVDLMSVADDAVLFLMGAVEKRKITLTKRLDRGLPRLSADRTQLTQVAVNMVKNACESFDGITDDRTREIRITLGPQAEGLELRVSDNGQGFDPVLGEQLFTPGKSTKAGGSGLGLVSCYGVARSHGGSFTLHSEGAGRGAVATLWLPLNIETAGTS